MKVAILFSFKLDVFSVVILYNRRNKVINHDVEFGKNVG